MSMMGLVGLVGQVDDEVAGILLVILKMLFLDEKNSSKCIMKNLSFFYFRLAIFFYWGHQFQQLSTDNDYIKPLHMNECGTPLFIFVVENKRD